MPGFPPSATVVTKVQRINIQLRDNVRTYRRSITEFSPNVVQADIDSWATNVGIMSTLGLEYYEGLGTRKQISIGEVVVFDELHSGSTNMIFNFQRPSDLNLSQFRLPGINAGFVQDGLVLRPVSDPNVGDEISAFLTAHLNILNKGLTGGAVYNFVGAFLDTAPRGAFQLKPQDSQVVEPDAGSDLGLPDNDDTP